MQHCMMLPRAETRVIECWVLFWNESANDQEWVTDLPCTATLRPEAPQRLSAKMARRTIIIIVLPLLLLLLQKGKEQVSVRGFRLLSS